MEETKPGIPDITPLYRGALSVLAVNRNAHDRELPYLNTNTLNVGLHPFCHFLALLGAHHILHVSRIRLNDSLVRVAL